jgi:[ribosomal protein S5]-alanine N-acetyltransferase
VQQNTQNFAQNKVQLLTQRLRLEAFAPRHVLAVQQYYLRNASHLQPWDPKRPPDFLQPERFARTAAAWLNACAQGQALRFVLFDREADGTHCIGLINFSQIVPAPFQACTLGYSLDAAHTGKGLMREALASAIAHMQTQRRMHRIMANHLPNNHKSATLLAALGFEREGYAKAYLQINGSWQDHVLTSLTCKAIEPD